MSLLRPRVLFFGCGNIAGQFDIFRNSDLWPLTHAGAYRRHGGFELAACVDPLPETRGAFAQHYKIPCHAATIGELKPRVGDFDVVSICSPTVFHQEHLEAALHLSPRLIFCEKPLTHTVELTRKWSQVCSNQGVRLVVNYSRQWDPTVAKVIEDLRGGAWGAIRSAVGIYNKGVHNNGGHLVDLLLRILGPLRVVAATPPIFDYWENDPTVAGLLVSVEDKVPVSLNVGNAQDFSMFELELICEMGVIRMRNGGMNWEFRRMGNSNHFKGYRELTNNEIREGELLKAMTLAVTEIYDFLKGNNPILNSGENALAVQDICDQLFGAAMQATLETK